MVDDSVRLAALPASVSTRSTSACRLTGRTAGRTGARTGTASFFSGVALHASRGDFLTRVSRPRAANSSVLLSLSGLVGLAVYYWLGQEKRWLLGCLLASSVVSSPACWACVACEAVICQVSWHWQTDGRYNEREYKGLITCAIGHLLERSSNYPLAAALL